MRTFVVVGRPIHPASAVISNHAVTDTKLHDLPTDAHNLPNSIRDLSQGEAHAGVIKSLDYKLVPII